MIQRIKAGLPRKVKLLLPGLKASVFFVNVEDELNVISCDVITFSAILCDVTAAEGCRFRFDGCNLRRGFVSLYNHAADLTHAQSYPAALLGVILKHRGKVTQLCFCDAALPPTPHPPPQP